MAVRALDAGDRVRAWACDVGDETQVERAFAGTVEHFGTVDSCFANAAVGGRDVPFVELELDEWHEVLRTDLDGAFLTLRAAARHMVGAGGGSLVATSSLAAISGRAQGQAYAAAKGALISVVRGLAVELARHGVRANAILPGFFETAMTQEALDTEVARRKILPRIPARRWGEPAEVGALAVYLAGPASAYLTGQTLVLDGGYSVF